MRKIKTVTWSNGTATFTKWHFLIVQTAIPRNEIFKNQIRQTQPNSKGDDTGKD